MAKLESPRVEKFIQTAEELEADAANKSGCEKYIELLADLVEMAENNADGILLEATDRERSLMADAIFGTLKTGELQRCFGENEGEQVVNGLEFAARSIEQDGARGFQGGLVNDVKPILKERGAFVRAEVKCITTRNSDMVDKRLNEASGRKAPKSISTTSSPNGELIACAVLEDVAKDL
jgi:hypothetical protein